MQTLLKPFKKVSHLVFAKKFFYQTLSDDLKLTEICVKKIEEKTAKNDQKFLRLIVESGGLKE